MTLPRQVHRGLQVHTLQAFEYQGPIRLSRNLSASNWVDEMNLSFETRLKVMHPPIPQLHLWTLFASGVANVDQTLGILLASWVTPSIEYSCSAPGFFPPFHIELKS